MKYNQIKISIQQAEKILFELYGIKGNASLLPGYVDFNFRIKVTNKEGFILKISRPKENKKYLEFQQHLLQFIKNESKNLIAPKPIKDKNNNLISEIIDEYDNQRSVRLLTWVSGKVWGSENPQLEDFRFSLGKQCGLLTKVLQGFDHPEAHTILNGILLNLFGQKNSCIYLNLIKKRFSFIFKISLKHIKHPILNFGKVLFIMIQMTIILLLHKIYYIQKQKQQLIMETQYTHKLLMM